MLNFAQKYRKNIKGQRKVNEQFKTTTPIPFQNMDEIRRFCLNISKGKFRNILFNISQMENRMSIPQSMAFSKNQAQLIHIPTESASGKQSKTDIFFKKLKGFTKPLYPKQKLVEMLFNRFRGTHLPLDYRSEYKFQERWQQISKQKWIESDSIRLNNSIIFNVIQCLIMLNKGVVIWFLTIYRLFDFAQSWNIFQMSIGFYLIDLALSVYLIWERYEKSDGFIQHYYWIELSLKGLSTLCVIVVFALSPSSYFLVVIDILCICLSRQRFHKIYRHLSITLVPQNYRHYITITDFLFKLLTIIHAFAILLFLATFASPENNWLEHIGQQNQDSFTKYVSSLYFSTTTLATVGYGDILPVNNLQKFIIIITQIIGIITLGYIINEIGRCLSQLRTTHETFQRDLINTQKISNYYQLPQQLKARVRSYVINNQEVTDSLDTKDEQNLMMKLSQNLRNQVKQQNNINIVKTSLFFICNWSRRVQIEAAKKLSTFVVMPGQKITNFSKIYIINRGSFDLMTERRGTMKLHCRKQLKMLNKKQTNQVHHNCFGYASFFSSKPTKLYALAKEFSICSTIQFNDLKEFISDSPQDFQHYHRIHAQLQLIPFPDKIQCSEIINNRHNFYPIPYFVLKRYCKQTEPQKRKRCFRQRQRSKMRMITLTFDGIQTIPEFERETTDNSSFTDDSTNQNEDNKNIAGISNNLPLQLSINNINSQNLTALIVNRSYQRRFCKKSLIEQKIRQENAQILLLRHVVETSLFQTAKNYNRYFPKGNIHTILKNISKRQNYEMSEHTQMLKSARSFSYTERQQLVQSITALKSAKN